MSVVFPARIASGSGHWQNNQKNSTVVVTCCYCCCCCYLVLSSLSSSSSLPPPNPFDISIELNKSVEIFAVIDFYAHAPISKYCTRCFWFVLAVVPYFSNRIAVSWKLLCKCVLVWFWHTTTTCIFANVVEVSYDAR